MHAIRWSTLAATVLVGAALVAVPPATAQPLDAETFKAYGGTYNSDCKDNTAPRVTLFEESIVFLQGSRRTASRSVQPSGGWFGNSPPEGYVMTFVGDMPDGRQVILSLWDDAAGRYATIDGDQGLIDARIAGKVKFRNCAAGATKADGAGKAANEGSAADAPDAANLKDEEFSGSGMITLRPKFKAAYLKLLGSRARTPWLATLAGPSPQNRKVRVAGQEYLLVAACKDHDCHDHNVVVLWSEPRNTVYAMVHEAGKSVQLGKPSPAVSKELGALWRKTFRSTP